MADLLTRSTLSPPSPEDESLASIVVLTILCHPDLTRVGERSVLEDLLTLGRIALSRSSPLFGPAPGLPLGDPYLSRQPIELTLEDGLEVRPPVVSVSAEVNGQRLDGPRRISTEELDGGVVIELAGRVALLLHRERSMPEQGGIPRFGLIGASQPMESLRRSIHQVAALPVSVLLRGETGSGKELVARAIAEASPFAAPFIPVNMGAIPPSVAASELFGTAKGAFTGAVPSDGYFRRANGGTLFLDEVGQTPYEVQAHLLRALDQGEVQPLGDRTPFPVKVRVIAATDSDLEQSIAAGGFMQALLQRLATFPISIPPLRERLDDLGRLLLHFLRGELAALGEEHRLEPRPIERPPWLSARLVAQLARYDWPGNVRELRNVARQIAISSRGRSEAWADPNLLGRLRPRTAEPAAPGATSVEGPQACAPPTSARAEKQPLTAERLADALRATARNYTKAAKALGISRTTLLKKAKEAGLYRGPDDVSDEELSALAAETNGDLEAMAEQLQQSRRGLELRLAKLQRRATAETEPQRDR